MFRKEKKTELSHLNSEYLGIGRLSRLGECDSDATKLLIILPLRQEASATRHAPFHAAIHSPTAASSNKYFGSFQHGCAKGFSFPGDMGLGSRMRPKTFPHSVIVLGAV
jgi:hypothetical protein